MDDMEFKELVKEKGRLYSRKVKGTLDEVGGLRLVEVSREVCANLSPPHGASFLMPCRIQQHVFSIRYCRLYYR